MKRKHILFTLLAVCLCGIARGQTSQYWFDDDYTGMKVVNTTSGIIQADISALEPGLHTLHYLSVSNSGVPSSTYTKQFFIPHEAVSAKAEYWFDTDFDGRKTLTQTSGKVTIDASNLQSGLHTIWYQQLEADGTPSSPYCKAFVVEGHPLATRGEYWFDDNYAGRKTLALQQGAAAIDLTGLGAGLHALHYHALAADGLPSSAYTKLFLIGRGTSEVKAYHYWVNDNTNDLQTQTLETPIASYKLTTGLDVPKYPIRTSMFHFEMVNGQPMVYAKNTLNIVFENVDGTSVRIESDYVDYRVSEAVDAPLLQPSEEKTVATGDVIRWFRVEVSKGDSLAFRANSGCTLELFSPTGAQLWTVGGNDATRVGGTRADQNGTFYLALHDVTDKHLKEITVTYLWEEAPIEPGDVNGDQTVDVADIATIISVMASAITPDASASGTADVNGDGVVDVADIATVISIMAANARLAGDMEY